MKMKKLLPLSFISLLALVSCGSGTSHVVDQDLPEDDPTSAQEVVFWHCLGHAKTTNLEKIVNAFNTEYAGKYHVTLTKLGGDYDTLHDALKTKLASGEIPALSMGYPDSFSEYMTNDITQSSLLRLDNFLKDKNYGYSETEIADFVPGYYNEGNQYQFDGVWSMPMYKSTEVMYYNQSYFMGVNKLNAKKFKDDVTFMAMYNNCAGRTSENDPELQDDLAELKEWLVAHDGYTYEVPTKWNDMVTLARKMKADRATEGITDEFYGIGYDSDANMMISQMKQRGLAYTDSKGSEHFLFNNAQTDKLVEEITGYIKEGIFITKNSLGGTKYTNTYFGDEKIAMSIGSTGGSSYQISGNFSVKLAPVPYSGDTPYYIQQGPSICFFDNENPYMHKGAWLFYKKLAEPQNNADLALENSYDPIRISSYETASYKAWLANEGKGLKYDIPSITARLKNNYMTSAVFVGSGTARTEIGNTIKYVMRSGYSVRDSVQAAWQACDDAD
ncbi:MAG: extracellular solute-binding protein [Bacilli bacterium]|nr:extracellular solute-binding protein [Bacilli bacterium]